MQMTKHTLRGRTAAAVGIASILLATTDLGWSRIIPAKPAPAAAKAAPAKATVAVAKTTPAKTATLEFSGQATVISLTNIHVGPSSVIIGDTGQLPKTGGTLEVSVGQTNMEGLSLELGYATTRGMDDTASSGVSLSGLSLTVLTTNGDVHTITIDTINIDASVSASTAGITFDAQSNIQGLAVDGVSIEVTGSPNQVVDLGDFSLIINDQVTSSTEHSGVIALAALHIIDPGCMEGFIGLVHADIRCTGTHPAPTVGCEDFITGGGWIVGPSGAKANFAVGGGIRHGTFWGHLNYIDHATGMHVKATAVTGYDVTVPLTRVIHYNVTIDGAAGTAVVRVTDNGEPGHNDIFEIALSNGYSAAGNLSGERHRGGGNIQLHKPKCREQGGNDKPCDKDKDKGKDCEKDKPKDCDKDKDKEDKDKDCDKDKSKECDKDKPSGKSGGKDNSKGGGNDDKCAKEAPKGKGKGKAK